MAKRTDIKKILIIGSGAIGIEWARIMSNFGVETTVVELAPHLLPLADIEVSKRIERIFKQNKITSYEFVASSDALISDYSSIYFDYTEKSDQPICFYELGRYASYKDVISYQKGFTRALVEGYNGNVSE